MDGLQGLPAPQQQQILESLETIVRLMEAHHLDAGAILATGSLASDAREDAAPLVSLQTAENPGDEV